MWSLTRRGILTALVAAVSLLVPAGDGAGGPEPVVKSAPTAAPLGQPRVLVSDTAPLLIDRIYHSMTGPYQFVQLDAPDLDWVTAIKTEIIDDDTGEAMSDEFFCHSQLQIEAVSHLAVSATGASEVRFPPGFGIPTGRILRSAPADARRLTFLGMVLNNHQPDIHRNARIRSTLEYYSDLDVGTPPALKKLYMTNIMMRVQNIERYEPGTDDAPVHDDVTTHCALVGEHNAHWIVSPGPQRTRRTVSGIVPVEATVHYAQAHMHNHGRSISLRDKTTGEMLWRAEVEHEPDRAQIKTISTYSSAEGFRIYPDHEYEIEVFYDNTSDVDVDAMAVVYLYFNPLGDGEIVLKRPDTPES